MGEVWLAEDTQLPRKVAVKLLPRHMAEDPDAVARLLREAHAAASVDHPGVVTVYEAGVHDGRPYLVMQRVEGETLEARLARGPLSVPDALTLGIEVADALAEVHALGIVHRDLKPANVIMSPRGARVLDFGVASVQGSPRLTTAGVAVGTPLAMAPEQLRGQPADNRTDLWALGVMLYRAVTGSPPFAGGTVEQVMHRLSLQPAAECPAPRPAGRAGLHHHAGAARTWHRYAGGGHRRPPQLCGASGAATVAAGPLARAARSRQRQAGGAAVRAAERRAGRRVPRGRARRRPRRGPHPPRRPARRNARRDAGLPRPRRAAAHGGARAGRGLRADRQRAPRRQPRAHQHAARARRRRPRAVGRAVRSHARRPVRGAGRGLQAHRRSVADRVEAGRARDAGPRAHAQRRGVPALPARAADHGQRPRREHAGGGAVEAGAGARPGFRARHGGAGRGLRATGDALVGRARDGRPRAALRARWCSSPGSSRRRWRWPWCTAKRGAETSTPAVAAHRDRARPPGSWSGPPGRTCRPVSRNRARRTRAAG